MTAGGYAAISSGPLSRCCCSAARPLSVVVLPRVRIARMVPCETWAPAAISRWASPTPDGALSPELEAGAPLALFFRRRRSPPALRPIVIAALAARGSALLRLLLGG